MKLRTSFRSGRVRFVRDVAHNKKDLLTTDSAVLDEYDLQPMVGMRAQLSDPTDSSSALQYHTLRIDTLLRRKPQYYLWNVVFIQAWISLISLSTVLVDVDDFAARMEMVLTVLLSVVAFKYVVSDALPNINYLTTLDKYMLLSFMMVMFVIIEASISKWLLWWSDDQHRKLAEDFDFWFAIFFLVPYWLGTQIWFGHKVFVYSYKQKFMKDYEDLSQEYTTIAASQQKACERPVWRYFSPQLLRSEEEVLQSPNQNLCKVIRRPDHEQLRRKSMGVRSEKENHWGDTMVRLPKGSADAQAQERV